MFCQNCGSEVKDDDLFCGECGAKIERTEVPESEPVKKEAAPQSESVRTAAGFSDKAKKIIIAEIAVLVVLIAAFFYLGNKKSSPESAANQFVKDYNSQRWSKIYDLYNFEEDTFINQEAYEQTMEQSETKTLSAPTGGYTEYGTYAGQYIYQTKKGSDTITIHVAKSAKKNFLFFDKYEVTSITDTSATIKTVKLFTMPGVTVKVDGIAAKVPENTSGNTYYTRMFEGTHKITFHGADGLFDQTSYTFKTGEENPLSKIKYSDSAKAEAAKELKNYLPKITEAKIRNLGNSGLTSYFTSDQKANSYGTSLCRYIYYYGQDAKALGNVKLTKCQAVDATSSYYTVADGIPVAVQGTRGYKYKNGWTGSYEKQTCTINGVAKMLKKNGKWVIDSVSYYYY